MPMSAGQDRPLTILSAHHYHIYCRTAVSKALVRMQVHPMRGEGGFLTKPNASKIVLQRYKLLREIEREVMVFDFIPVRSPKYTLSCGTYPAIDHYRELDVWRRAGDVRSRFSFRKGVSEKNRHVITFQHCCNDHT
jgi:hypothetical protein